MLFVHVAGEIYDADLRLQPCSVELGRFPIVQPQAKSTRLGSFSRWNRKPQEKRRANKRMLTLPVVELALHGR
jgi:hypothetical protein